MRRILSIGNSHFQEWGHSVAQVGSKLGFHKKAASLYSFSTVKDRLSVCYVKSTCREECDDTVREVADKLSHKYAGNFLVCNVTPYSYHQLFSEGMYMEYVDLHAEDLKLLFQVCHSLYTFLLSSESHIAVVVTIKGEMDYGAAMLAACYLLYTAEEGEYVVGLQALEDAQLSLSPFHAPSQKRYINYFNVLFMLPELPNTKRLLLRRLVVQHNPVEQGLMNCEITVENNNCRLFSSSLRPDAVVNFGRELEMVCDIEVMGDFIINYYCSIFNPDDGDDEPLRVHLFRFTFTTLFIICPPGAARLVRAAKGELDFANSMDMLSPEFCLITEFQEGQTQAPDAGYIDEIEARLKRAPRARISPTEFHESMRSAGHDDVSEEEDDDITCEDDDDAPMPSCLVGGNLPPLPGPATELEKQQKLLRRRLQGVGEDGGAKDDAVK
eukprot:EG_transcript_12721